MNSEICPKCNGLLELDGTCSCGYRPKIESKPRPRLCAFNDHGDSCHRPGHLSTGTLGTGPWYCRSHFARIMGWPSWEASVTEEPMSEVDKRVNKLVPRLEGESEHDWSMRCRLWVMAYVTRLSQQEPGANG